MGNEHRREVPCMVRRREKSLKHELQGRVDKGSDVIPKDTKRPYIRIVDLEVTTGLQYSYCDRM